MITVSGDGATSAMADLAAEVRHYLTQRPRQLPSRALYDTLGTALFEAICELPWYPLTRAERRLLTTHREAILREAQWPQRVVELGGGNGSKLDLLLGGSQDARHPRRLELVDVSPTALRDAERRLTEQRAVDVVSHVTPYEEGLRAIAQAPLADERTLLVFLGSNIGNYDPAGAAQLLARMHESLRRGDTLLIGVDLVKPERQLLLAYDDPLGVTAAFNRNLLVRLNRELGATFELGRFSHRAVWNASASRVEMHLVSQTAQAVSIAASGIVLEFGPGDSMWTESSYKYRVPDFDRTLEAAGFSRIRHYVDESDAFLLALADV